MQKLRYRLRSGWRRLVLALGFCPRCWTALNYTPRGRPRCPWNCKS